MIQRHDSFIGLYTETWRKGWSFLGFFLHVNSKLLCSYYALMHLYFGSPLITSKTMRRVLFQILVTNVMAVINLNVFLDLCQKTFVHIAWRLGGQNNVTAHDEFFIIKMIKRRLQQVFLTLSNYVYIKEIFRFD